ncbi:MAG: asparagine synthase (glutamine-hydrolyzing) [Betaproteobacteria bacterium]|nr:asparagine synthase (glutamine-hydrolyzing) [Betaproteobacteria bacterium]
MCGIAGYFGRRPIGEATRVAMFAAIARRGPDAAHFVGWDGAWRRVTAGDVPRGLFSTRLSIRDPRPLADMPMGNERGDLWVCYNGEVYGWEDDARRLAAETGPFGTRSDTEFILRGYEAWGLEALLPKLRGMFALAILDLRRGKLALVRDRMGVKPLVYCHRGGELAFGSTVRAVLPCVPAGERGFSAEGIDAFLAHRYVPAPRTVFRAIARLENAHLLEYDLASGALEKRCYWKPEPAPGEDLGRRLDEAVELRTVADRPVGVFLSSGIDSSVVASRLAATGHGELHSFTARFADPAMDESALAAQGAAKLGMPNTAVAMPDDVAADFAQIVADLDEPFADPSSFPTWYLARETTRRVKVVLCGDGGDELFGGYKRYRQHLRSAWRLRLPLAPFPGRPAGILPTRRRRLAAELAMSWRDAYALRFSGFGPLERRALQPGFAVAGQYWRGEADGARSPLEQLLAIDHANYLPEYVLRKADLMTMAHGLEARPPLLDHRFVECVLGLPAARRFTHPAKRALAPFCPPCVELGLFARKKRGFNPPLERLVRTDLGERLGGLGASLAHASAGQIAAAPVETLVRAYENDDSLAEKMLQLLMLDESLRQLAELARAAP